MNSWPERDDVILSQWSIHQFFTILMTLISVLLNTRCAFLICSAGRTATRKDNRALVLIDIHPHSQAVASALRQPATVHVVQLHDLKWPECDTVLCVLCPFAQDCWSLHWQRLEQNWTRYWRHTFSESVHLKFVYLLNMLSPAYQEVILQPRNKVHTRQGLSSTFTGFQQLVSNYENISKYCRCEKWTEC